nr:hypothetical protein [Botryosphaeria dothidea fusarivirus 2]
MSTSNNENSPLAIFERQIEQLKSSPVTYSGKSGYFVAKERLDSVEKNILKEMETSESPSRLIELQEELETIRKSSTEANKALQDAQKAISEKNHLIVTLKKKRDEALVEKADNLAMINSERANLVESLKLATEEKQRVQKEFEKAKKGFDPEKALELEEALASQKALVGQLQKDLELVNADKQAVAAQAASLNASIMVLDQEKRKLEHEVHAFVEAKKKNSSPILPEITVPRPEIKSDVLRKLLGERGIEWLQKAEQAVADDYRQRVYSLMVATKGGKTSNLRSISQLLETVFRWLKLQSYRLRKSIAAWVDEIEHDIRSAAIKSVSYYRDKLAELRDDIIAKRNAEKKTDHDEPMSWFDDLYYTVLVLRNRFVRKSRGFFSPIKRVFTSLWNWIRPTRNPTNSDHISKEDFFDAEKYAEELKADEKKKGKKPMTYLVPKPEDDSAGSSNSVPPPPPPPGKLGRKHPGFANIANLFGAK